MGPSTRIALRRLPLIALAAALAAGLAAPAARAATRPVQIGVSPTGGPQDPASIDSWAQLTGVQPSIVMWYQDWYPGWTNALVVPRFMDAVTERGAMPMITWEPDIGSDGVSQPAYALRNIARGDFDGYIERSAREAAAYGKPFYLRLAHEMNGDWSAWGAGVNGNTPADFVAAWRHVVGIFRSAGATNAIWVWSPNVDTGRRPFAQLYPGDEWVDWVGLDGYNWGTLDGSRWKSLGEVFGSSYDTLTRLTSKPLMIAETASTEVGGDKAAWIRDGFQYDLPARLPAVRAVIWFDRDKETDWRVNSSTAATSAFRSLAAPAPPAVTSVAVQGSRLSLRVSGATTVVCTVKSTSRTVRKRVRKHIRKAVRRGRAALRLPRRSGRYVVRVRAIGASGARSRQVVRHVRVRAVRGASRARRH